ncbi:MAG: TonB-dependent receptor [Bacteroidota bacterium]
MRWLLFLALWFCISIRLYAQPTIWGYVLDQESQEPIPGAIVQIPHEGKLIFSNSVGFFSLKIQAQDRMMIICRAMGYLPDSVLIDSSIANPLDISLRPSVLRIDSVEISAASRLIEMSIGKVSMTAEEMDRIPALGGESDVMRSLQILPGVQSSHEASSGLLVRGGSADQNLILLDGVPVYNANHMLGIISTFHTDAVKKADFYKGGFPARFGGRLSSIVDISLKEGSREKLQGTASLGLLSSKLLVEGPIKGGKSSYMVSARRSFLDIFSEPIQRLSQQANRQGYGFYDITAKINHEFSKRNRMFISLYGGRDRYFSKTKETLERAGLMYKLDNSSSLQWGNKTAVLRWTHVGKSAWFNQFMGYVTEYKFAIEESQNRSTSQIGTEEEDKEAFQLLYQSLIRDITVQNDLQHSLSSNQTLRLGVQGTFRTFSPATFVFDRQVSDSTLRDSSNNLTASTGWEWNAYVENSIQLIPSFNVNLGVRLSGFVIGTQNYSTPQIRASLAWNPYSHGSIRASYSRMTQYIHLLSSSNVSLPIDLWVSSTDQVPPQQGWQVSGGWTHELESVGEFSLEGYFKRMNQIIAYQEGANLLLDGADPTVLSANRAWESQVINGRGWSYGAELFFRHRLDPFSGWFSYSLSWTRRQFDGLNQGEPFPYIYDRRHNISLGLVYPWQANKELSLQWVFQSGRATNLPQATYTTHPFFTVGGSEQYIATYGDRNSFRLRPYHRLDLSLSWKPKKKKGKRGLSLGLYNAYSRRNPFALTYFSRPGTPYLIENSLFPILPIIAYRWTF